jgi:general secretion pathway protein A
MYESYWQLGGRPFEHSLDQRFYYPGETHQGALLKLRYAIENRRGAALLTGPAGSGKSLLVQILKKQLGESCTPFAHVVFPQMTSAELLAHVARELGAILPEGRLPSSDQTIARIQERLNDVSASGRHAIIALDEAHLLQDNHSLEAMRLLLNFESGAAPCLTLLLVGQPTLLPMVDRMPGLEQRLAVKCLLRPLTVEETISYVTHRMQGAGARPNIFEPAALELLAELTQGIIRRINRLCDLALLIGYAEERQSIGPQQLESICQELVTVTPE